MPRKMKTDAGSPSAQAVWDSISDLSGMVRHEEFEHKEGGQETGGLWRQCLPTQTKA